MIVTYDGWQIVIGGAKSLSQEERDIVNCITSGFTVLGVTESVTGTPIQAVVLNMESLRLDVLTETEVAFTATLESRSVQALRDCIVNCVEYFVIAKEISRN